VLHTNKIAVYVESDEYSVARGKLSRAEETSTLETDEETRCQHKRKRKAVLFDDELHDLNDKMTNPKKKDRSCVPLPSVPPSLQRYVMLSSIQDELSGKSRLCILYNR